MNTLNQGDYPEPGDVKDVGLTDGFKFTITAPEAQQLGVQDNKQGDECKFIVTATIIKANPNGDKVFQAKEIEWVYDENTAQPSDMVGASPMYKAGMAKPQKTKVTFVRPTTEPYVS